VYVIVTQTKSFSHQEPRLHNTHIHTNICAYIQQVDHEVPSKTSENQTRTEHQFSDNATGHDLTTMDTVMESNSHGSQTVPVGAHLNAALQLRQALQDRLTAEERDFQTQVYFSKRKHAHAHVSTTSLLEVYEDARPRAHTQDMSFAAVSISPGSSSQPSIHTMSPPTSAQNTTTQKPWSQYPISPGSSSQPSIHNPSPPVSAHKANTHNKTWVQYPASPDTLPQAPILSISPPISTHNIVATRAQHTQTTDATPTSPLSPRTHGASTYVPTSTSALQPYIQGINAFMQESTKRRALRRYFQAFAQGLSACTYCSVRFSEVVASAYRAAMLQAMAWHILMQSASANRADIHSKKLHVHIDKMYAYTNKLLARLGDANARQVLKRWSLYAHSRADFKTLYMTVTEKEVSRRRKRLHMNAWKCLYTRLLRVRNIIDTLDRRCLINAWRNWREIPVRGPIIHAPNVVQYATGDRSVVRVGMQNNDNIELAHSVGVYAVRDVPRGDTEVAQPDKVCAVYDARIETDADREDDPGRTMSSACLSESKRRERDKLLSMQREMQRLLLLDQQQSDAGARCMDQTEPMSEFLPMQNEMQRTSVLDQRESGGEGKGCMNEGASMSESRQTTISWHAPEVTPIGSAHVAACHESEDEEQGRDVCGRNNAGGGMIDAQFMHMERGSAGAPHVRADHDQRPGMRAGDSEHVQNVTGGVVAAEVRACESEKRALQRKLEQVQLDMHALKNIMHVHETKNSALEEDLRTCVAQRDSLQSKVGVYEAERDALQASLRIAAEEFALVCNGLRLGHMESRHYGIATQLQQGDGAATQLQQGDGAATQLQQGSSFV
jgi:hypothetical protein